MQCKWHVNSWLHSKFKFCYLELPRIFFQIFSILAWLNPWMWNLQVLRADYIHFPDVFLASVILDLELRTIKLSNWSLAHGHQARDSICHPSLKWDMNEGKWCMEPLVTSLKIKSLMQDLLFFLPACWKVDKIATQFQQEKRMTLWRWYKGFPWWFSG